MTVRELLLILQNANPDSIVRYDDGDEILSVWEGSANNDEWCFFVSSDIVY